MRVFQVFMRPYPPVEGVGNYVKNLAYGLHHVQRDLEIILISLWDYKNLRVEFINEEIRLLKVPRYGRSFLRSKTARALIIPYILNKAIRQYFKPSKEEILHVHVPLYIRIKGSYGLTFHGFQYPIGAQLRNSIKILDELIPTKVLCKNARAASFMSTVSYSSRELLSRFFKIPKENIHVIPAPLNVEILSSIKEEKERGQGSFRIAFAGGAVKSKGVYDLIKAIAYLKSNRFETIRDSEVYIFGEGDTQHLKHVVLSLGLPEIKVLTRLPHEKALAVIANSDLLVHPSYHEGLSTVVLEALVLGKPVLVSDAPGNIDLALMFNLPKFRTGDIADLANKILDITSDYKYYNKHIQHARSKVLEICRPINLAKKYIRLYKRCIESS